MNNTISKTERIPEIDWLRVFAVFILFYYHTARLFDSIAPFYLKNFQSSIFLDILMFFIDKWQLPVLFLVSGVATWFSIEVRSKKEFLKERFKRLFVPFTFATIFVIPPQLYCFLKTIPGYPYSFSEFFFSYFFNINSQYPFGGSYSGSFELGHTWFLAILFLFCLFTLPLFSFLKKEKGRKIITKIADSSERPGFLVFLALPLVFVEVLVRSFAGWSFSQNPFLYLFFFIYGFFLYSDERFKKVIAKEGKAALILALFFTLVVFSMDWQNLNSLSFKNTSYNYLSFDKYFFEAVKSLSAWCWILSFIYLFQKFMSFSNKFLKRLNEAVLPIYVLHQTVIVIVGFFVLSSGFSLLLKYLLISHLSLLACFLLYQIIKRINLLRVLFGMRPLK